MAPHVDDADPMGAIVAHIGLRSIRQEDGVERFNEAWNRFDLGERHHVDHRNRVAFRVPLVVPTAIRRKREVLRRDVDRNHLDQLQRVRVDDVGLVRTRPARHDVSTVRRHHHHVRIDVVAEKRLADDLLRLDVHERDFIGIAVHDHDHRRRIGDLDGDRAEPGTGADGSHRDNNGADYENPSCRQHGWFS